MSLGGTGTDRDWWFFVVVHTSRPPTSDALSAMWRRRALEADANHPEPVGRGAREIRPSCTAMPTMDENTR